MNAMMKYLSWRTWIGWLPLIWLAVFALTLNGTCHYFGWPQCIGRTAPEIANTWFWLSKWIAMVLLILALTCGLMRKLTRVGWLGFALSLFPAIYHFMTFID